MLATATKLRVLVVDDSSLYRKIVRDVLQSMPDVEVIGTAHDGAAAVERIEALRPDLITLDLEMPQLDGIGVLREMKARGIECAAIMVSAFTTHGAQTTMAALSEGAFDFILKPTTSSVDQSIEQLRADLEPKLTACRLGRVARRGRPFAPVAPPTTADRPANSAASTQRVDIVGIGISTGGPQALTQMLPQLAADFPCPIVVVQHMPPLFTKSLADDLNRHCRLSVCEGAAGQVVRPGTVTIAPGGKQMRIVATGHGPTVEITDDAPERNCRPAVDYLFRSLANLYGGRTLGVIMTGMGDDGTEGCRLLANQQATILAQEAASCVVYGMPKSVVDAGLATHIIPLGNMAQEITNCAWRGRNR